MRTHDRDLHVLKYFSSVITVSEGKVINVTDPSLRSCPLASRLYPELREADPKDPGSLKGAIRKIIDSKIRDHGFFTGNRSFDFPRVAIPCGASEMLASALARRLLDSAVVVCEGAGTVICDSPETVQGIGARMNTLIFTSPIPAIHQKLKNEGCHIPFKDNAWIDQSKGVEKAVSLGYKKIGVTITGTAAEQIERIRNLEKTGKAEITVLAVCTSGVPQDKIEIIRQNADLVWSCASGKLRGRIGPEAKLQLSKQIPVYALTDRGVSFINSFLNKRGTLPEAKKIPCRGGMPRAWIRESLLSSAPPENVLRLSGKNERIRA